MLAEGRASADQRRLRRRFAAQVKMMASRPSSCSNSKSSSAITELPGSECLSLLSLVSAIFCTCRVSSQHHTLLLLYPETRSRDRGGVCDPSRPADRGKETRSRRRRDCRPGVEGSPYGGRALGGRAHRHPGSLRGGRCGHPARIGSPGGRRGGQMPGAAGAAEHRAQGRSGPPAARGRGGLPSCPAGAGGGGGGGGAVEAVGGGGGGGGMQATTPPRDGPALCAGPAPAPAPPAPLPSPP